MKQIKYGAALASAVAMSFVAGEAVADSHGSDANDKVKCVGGNACKGHGVCATDTHACAGQNSCQGQGWVYLTKEECKAIPDATIEE